MIKLGEFQTLTMVRRTDFGIYLSDNPTEDPEGILLPNKEVPEDIEQGDQLDVFIYKDSEDRLISTCHTPKITMGEIKKLRVVQLTKIGAFLDWGLLKDLFLPFKEQIGRLQEGESYLVGLYIDKSERLCATMKLSKLLSAESPYKEGDRVTSTIFSMNRDYGLFVAVEGKYHGMLPQKEVTKHYAIGDQIKAKIAKVNGDGKLVLTLKEDGFVQMEADEKVVYEALLNNGGFLPLNDKSDKDIINKELHLSKRAFKRSVGRLMKSGKIIQTEQGIEIKK